MANEPERPIEKLLRAAAQKRRDEAGAPFELHPANRRMLQGEVARTFPRAPRETRSAAGLLAALWPRLAGGLAILAVLGMAAWLLVPPSGKNEPAALLAKNKVLSETVSASRSLVPAPAAPATMPAPAAAEPKNAPALAYFDSQLKSARNARNENGALDQPLAGSTASGQLAMKKDSDRMAGVASSPRVYRELRSPAAAAATDEKVPAPPVTAAPSIAPSSDSYASAPAPVASAAPAGRFGFALGTPPAAAPPQEQPSKLADTGADQSAAMFKSLGAASGGNRAGQPPLNAEAVSRATTEESKQAARVTVGQQFVQVSPQAKDKSAFADSISPAQPVLASFQVQQTGRQMRIVDGDGSVYLGYLQLPAPARRARAAQGGSFQAPSGTLARDRESQSTTIPGSGVGGVLLQSYSFRVAGTNRSLQKQVVFTGTLLTPTNLVLSLPPESRLDAVGSLSGVVAKPTQPNAQVLQQSRISGKAVIGNGKPIKIDALPTNP